jgi:hypothetical protein
MRSAHALAAHRSFAALLRAPLGAGLAPRRLNRAENIGVGCIFSHISYYSSTFIDWRAKDCSPSHIRKTLRLLCVGEAVAVAAKDGHVNHLSVPHIQLIGESYRGPTRRADVRCVLHG